jgi:nucleotide-binding universal stress UspA family protein
MFKHILCPVDFSEASEHAIKYAIALARIHRADLTALHVCAPPLTTPVLPPAGSGSQAADEVRLLGTEVAALFEDATRRGLRVDAVVGCGQPAREILTRAADLPADVIVLGTHGAGGFEHLVLGSVAEKVVRKATCPVFTVPPQAQFNVEAPFKKLVCAVDFSEWSLAALEEACAIAEESRGTVTAVHVIEWPWAEPPQADVDGIPAAQAAALLEYRRYQETMARSRLDATVKEVARDRCPVVARVLHGKPYIEVLCSAERERADLIVIGVHGRNALDVFFFGSTTHQVVRRAPCPVLTLRH